MRISPSLRAAETLSNINNRDTDDLVPYVVVLREQVELALDGNLNRGEAMLVCQAHTLDAIFNKLTVRALNAEHIHQLDTDLKLALRAQSQARATWQAVAAIQNPPIAGYIGQANIAHGPQQVNNGFQEAVEEVEDEINSNLQNKLLEETDGERLDTRATSEAGQTDSAMATVESLDRARDRRG